MAASVASSARSSGNDATISATSCSRANCSASAAATARRLRSRFLRDAAVHRAVGQPADVRHRRQRHPDDEEPGGGQQPRAQGAEAHRGQDSIRYPVSGCPQSSGTLRIDSPVPIGSAFHARTAPLAESLSFRDWAGYYAVSAYETHHDHEYNAIRNACALIDISPLFKYRVQGPDATRLVNRVITRDASRMQVGQVWYTPWCDDEGKVIDDGTVTRLAPEAYRWTAAHPNLRWLVENAHGLERRDRGHLRAGRGAGAAGADVARAADVGVHRARRRGSKYFRVASGEIAGVPVDVSRTGYTGDLGYEIWMPWDRAIAVWDALAGAGPAFDLHAAGMLALDVARVEAGLLLIDVDFQSSRKALIESQKYTPCELGLGRLVDLKKPAFVGRRRSSRSIVAATRARLWGSSSNGPTVEALYEAVGLPPAVAAQTSRVAVPVYRGRTQVGRATSTTWSTTLKKMIALATIDRPHFAVGVARGDGGDGRGHPSPRARHASCRRRSSTRRGRPRSRLCAEARRKDHAGHEHRSRHREDPDGATLGHLGIGAPGERVQAALHEA